MMYDFKKIVTAVPRGDKWGGRYLFAVTLAFILTAGLFLSACGGGGGSTPDSAVTVSFGEASYSVAEGESAVITVTLSADPGLTVVVPFTVAGTAQAGDYSGVPANVTFASGETLKSFTLTATDDTAREQSETVILNFGTLPEKITVGRTSSTIVTITDNDLTISCDDTGVIQVAGTLYDVKTADNGEDSDPNGVGVSICGNDMGNFILGGSGDDIIQGGDERDRIFGFEGDDIIHSGAGDDELDGGAGDDELDGGEGIDTVSYLAATRLGGALEALDISLEDGTAANDGYGDTDTLRGIENVRCGIEDGFTEDTVQGATIVGDDGPNLLGDCPSFAEDVIIGLGEDDVFLVNPGEDYYDGGDGTDTMDFSLYGLSGVEINLSLIEDGPVTHSTGNYGKIGDNTPADTETVAPFYPYVTYAKLEDESLTTVTAGEGNTTIENIVGTPGNDTLTGDAEDNMLTGGAGADMLAGGAGADTYHADSSDTITEADDEGDDTLYYEGAAITHDLTYTDLLGTGATRELAPAFVETVYGTSNDDTIRAAAGDVKLIGRGGQDTLIGGDGDNILIGCGGPNTFYSNTGESTSGDAPYTEPAGTGCKDADPKTCNANTFVLVYGSDTDPASVIDSFSTNDDIVLAGFGDSPKFTAEAALVSDLGDLTEETATTSEMWVDLKIDVAGPEGRSIAYIKSLDHVPTTSLTTMAAVLADALENTSGTVTDDDDYDTGCDQ